MQSLRAVQQILTQMMRLQWLRYDSVASMHGTCLVAAHDIRRIQRGSSGRAPVLTCFQASLMVIRLLRMSCVQTCWPACWACLTTCEDRSGPAAGSHSTDKRALACRRT